MDHLVCFDDILICSVCGHTGISAMRPQITCKGTYDIVEFIHLPSGHVNYSGFNSISKYNIKCLHESPTASTDDDFLCGNCLAHSTIIKIE
jgi:hypothetical protein